VEEIVGDDTGSIIVVGDQLGTVHIIQLTTGHVIFSQIVSEACSSKTFASIILTNLGYGRLISCKCELLVALTTGRVIRLTNIPVEEINALDNTEDILALVQGQISMQLIDTNLQNVSKVKPLGVGANGQQRYLFLSPGNRKVDLESIPISIWTEFTNTGFAMVDHLERNFFGSNVVQALIIPKSSYLVVLDAASTLYTLDLTTLILFKVRYLEGLCEISNAFNPERPGCIWCLFRNQSTYFVQFHIPSFEIVTQVPSYANSTFVKGSRYSDYIVAHNNSEFCFEIFEFVKSDPIQIICNYAKAKDSESAIKFAKERKLPISEYYKNVLRLHLDLSLDEIRMCVAEIQDPNFLSEYANECQNDDIQMISKVFTEVRKKIQAYNSKEAAQMMSTLTIRLGTFTYLLSKGMATSWNNDWQTFKLSNMLLNIQRAIANEDVTLGVTLWRRHCHDDQLHIHIKELLYSIPPQLNVETMILILDEFKYSLAKLPSQISEELRLTIDEWVYESSADIEQALRNPEAALQLLDSATRAEPSYIDSSISPSLQISYWSDIAKEKAYRHSDLYKKIQTRKFMLGDIIDLQKFHKYTISLASYEEQTPSLIGRMN
jgi:hypothetical protein